MGLKMDELTVEPKTEEEKKEKKNLLKPIALSIGILVGCGLGVLVFNILKSIDWLEWVKDNPLIVLVGLWGTLIYWLFIRGRW